MPTCKLCLKEKKLIKAHIFPDFLYNYIYEEKHKLFSISFDKSINENDKDIDTETIFTGEYDPNILCAECDNNVIGNYETKGSKILLEIYKYFGLKMPKNDFNNVETPKTNLKRFRNSLFSISPRFIRNNYVHLKNIDYVNFKLFILSILFKVAISKREFSKNIDYVGSLKELRKILLNNINISELYFPVTIQSYLHLREIPKGVILEPILIKERNYSCVKFLIPGLLITIILGNIIDNEKVFSKYILKDNGNMKIMIMKKDEIVKFMTDFKFMLI